MSSTHTHPAVGVDVGASGVRVAIALGDRTLRSSIAVPLPRANGHVDVVGLAGLIRRGMLEAVGEPLPAVATIAVGMASFPDLVESAEVAAREFASISGARRVVVANDALTTHLGALAGAPGTVIAAGTGAIALGTDHATTWIRADGWGLLLGDLGSGAWIGQQGVAAALRAAQGRADGSRELLGEFEQRFGTADRLVRDVYASPSPPSLLGELAPVVADAARRGDARAQTIWANAAEHLAATAAAAAIPGGAVSWSGGVFQAEDLILEPFLRALGRMRPDARTVAPRGSSLDGALELALRPARGEHPAFLRSFDTVDDGR